jgi:hypothetical protein
MGSSCAAGFDRYWRSPGRYHTNLPDSPGVRPRVCVLSECAAVGRGTHHSPLLYQGPADSISATAAVSMGSPSTFCAIEGGSSCAGGAPRRRAQWRDEAERW